MTDSDPRLLDALRELAGEDAAQVLDDAVAQGRAEATRIVRQRYVELLLRQVTERREPTPVELEAAEAGWYVYGIAWAGNPERMSGLPGVQGSRTEAIIESDLAAVASRVEGRRHSWGLASDGQVDPELLAPLATAHEHVLDELMNLGAVLPMRFGILYPSRDEIKAVLARQAGTITDSLEHLRDKAEWGLTVTWDPKTTKPLPDVRSDRTGEADRGRNYLDARRVGLARQARRADTRARLAAELHARLGSVAAAGVVHPTGAGSREDEEAGSEPVLKASYLVANRAGDDFRQAIVEGLAANADFGLRGDLTGPWPPYNFTRLELTETGL